MTLPELQQRAITAMELYATEAGNYGPLAEDAARKSHAYRKRSAREFTVIAADTATKRTDAAKQAIVDEACQMEMLERNLSDARERAAKIKIDQLKTEISLLQSLLRLETADRDMTRYGQGAGA